MNYILASDAVEVHMEVVLHFYKNNIEKKQESEIASHIVVGRLM